MKKRAIPAVLLSLIAMLIPGTAYASPSGGDDVTRFPTVEDMSEASGLSGTVQTAGYATAGDGGGMTYTITDTQPQGTYGNIAVRLADGDWAVPENLDEQTDAQADSTLVEHELTRAQSFAAAGTDLVWDSSRATPLSGKVIHATDSKPYALTCSSFVGMVLMGWDYEHTTYVADRNTQVGEGVDFGSAAHNGELWGAANLARWFHAHGETWLDDGSEQYQPGDVLFFSQQPTDGGSSVSSDSDQSQFANIYHVALYVGDGRIIHSYGPESGAGVIEEDFSASLQDDLSFVARPYTVTSQETSPDESADTSQEPPSETTSAAPEPSPTAEPSSAQATEPAGTDEAQPADPAGDDAEAPKPDSEEPAGRPWGLPRTGGTIMSFVGAAMVAVGTAASLVTRRRRRG
ncbi:LPXTG_anchor: LPXTG cell wall anchor domain [Propionibacterium ruminifibrarum]|uniref:LPXTG_anchor: LPXTG cell wall anchor domain n=1 Tax=Propionibacterium ruminifibrarum TaxID=1962131 RepID=A0A375I1I7_9ACTN|nr:LPXTG cell wall anchor domain-containing protein [Propionibacterium ruminifibrarum]SPF67966.1 LPXTG_anchor: LPXTG cell wall anchor domain [Propionibacterium ruminifibrarum]